MAQVVCVSLQKEFSKRQMLGNKYVYLYRMLVRDASRQVTELYLED